MNFLNSALLRFSMLPSALYTRMGVDVFQLECIVATKLTMDDRRPNPVRQLRGSRQPRPVKAATLGVALLNMILGFLHALIFSTGDNIVTQLCFYFSIFIITLGISLLSDFTTVLIDVRDNYIILPRPVNDRTVLLARLMHIFIHLCRLVIPLIIFPASRMFYRNIAGGIVFLLFVLLATLFTIFILNAVYLVVLKVTTPERFKSAIAFLQVAMAVGIYGGYQLLPRLVDKFGLVSFDVSVHPVLLLAPSYWFAAGWQILSHFSGTGQDYAGALLSVLVPVTSIYLVIKYLAPAFNRRLAQIQSSGDGKPARSSASPGKAVLPGIHISQRLAVAFTTSGAERAGFMLAWKLSGRNRDFMLKVYPTIGYMLVWIAMLWLSNQRASLSDIKEQNDEGKVVILAIMYMCTILLVSAAREVFYSDKYKASWVYFVAPVNKPGELISGGIKAIIAKFFLPVLLVTGIFLVPLTGFSVIPNLLLGLFNQILLTLLRVYLLHKSLPFSLYETASERTGGMLRNFAIFLLIPLLGIGQYFLYNNIPVVCILTLLSIAATWYIQDSIKNLGWNRVNKEYTE